MCSDSPRWMWWYRWLCWLLSASGVVCILIAHEHYSIDVVIGYFATTRTFWWYHTMANTHVSTHTVMTCAGSINCTCTAYRGYI